MELSKVVDKLFLSLDRDPELFYGWQANIAMAFKDEYERNDSKYKNKKDIHDISNTAAKNFLNSIISTVK